MGIIKIAMELGIVLLLVSIGLYVSLYAINRAVELFNKYMGKKVKQLRNKL